MEQSGYILAGFQTLAGILDNFILDTKGRFEDNFTREDIGRFFSESCSGFLHSYGEHFGGKKKWDKYSQGVANLLKKCRGYGFFNDSNLVVDSGGFQIATGRLTRNESSLLLIKYYEFLEEFYEVFDKAFILDVPPGANCETITDFDDLYKWNMDSYTKAANLPDHVREKVIYVHHFRSPKLWDTFDRILKENDFYSRFNQFGTGGIVASMSGDASIPCIIYVLPLIPIINETLKHGRNRLDFHVLGGANFRDILFYELFKIHVMKIHNLELNITYDSAGMYKALLRGRTLQVFHEDSIVKLDLRSANLDSRFKNNGTVAGKFRNSLNKTANRHGFKNLPFEEIYGETTFHEEIKVYAMLYSIDAFSIAQEKMRSLAENIYPMYAAGDVEFFNEHIELETRRINNDKITRKQKAKTNSIITSLDMLTNLDEEHCKYIVKKYLSKDEFTNLISSEQMLTV